MARVTKRPAGIGRFAESMISKLALQKSLKKWKVNIKNLKLKHPSRPVGKPWPKDKLVWYGMPPPCDMGPLLVDIMKKRGWKHRGLPCHAIKKWCGTRIYEDGWNWTVWTKEYAASLKRKSPKKMFGRAFEEGHRLRARRIPSHALCMMGTSVFRIPYSCTKEREDFSTMTQAITKGVTPDGNFRIIGYPGMEHALKKNNLAVAFKDMPWFPRSYTIPAESADLLKDIRGNKVYDDNYWICKPPNDYGGDGITVFHGSDKALRDVIRESDSSGQQVVQHYLGDPLLIGGYKFHARIHLAVTSLHPPEAYVQLNGQCLFATEPYVLSKTNTGKNFRPPVHVTNMCLNATKDNKENYFKMKPVIGRGQQFRVRFMESYLNKHHKGWNSEMFWKQVVDIAADTVLYMSKARSIRQHGKFPPGRFFEVFGMDLMLDKSFNVFMCEVNTSPGLDYPDKKILGEPNPDFAKETGLAGDTWHDLLALLGLDACRKQKSGSLKSWYKVDFEDRK